MRDYDNLLDRDRTRSVLMNWRRWARDVQRDPAEVHYYTVSPMFKAIVPTDGGHETYDTDSAMMVEEVLRIMFKPYRSEYRVIQAYYGEGMTYREIGKELGISHVGVLRHRMPTAEKIFSAQWAALVRGGKG